MCGIVGYIGYQNAKDVLLGGLERLEYRGYDSAGIALAEKGQNARVYKEKGRIAALKSVADNDHGATTGIGHTRWATHGAPSRTNAHPHESASGRFCLVHNGVIENDARLKQDYLQDVTLVSGTDTEVIVQLIDRFAREGLDTEAAFRKTLSLLAGSYAIALLDTEDEEAIYVAKNKSPLLIGLGADENVVASDSMAVIEITDRFVELMDQETVRLTRTSYDIKNLQGESVEREPYTVELDATDIEKGAYPHYMLKEIDEQPAVIRRIIGEYQDEDGNLKMPADVRGAMRETDRIYIIACGTSYHAGLVGKQLIEKTAGIPAEVHIASEFSYNMPLFSAKPLFIFISQSGETADIRSVLVQVKERSHKTLTVTNVAGSTLSRETDHTLLLHAGPEIAVASTKAYTAQIAVLALLAVDTARMEGMVLDFDPIAELGIAANAMQALIEQKEEIEEVAREYLSLTRNCFFIGRASDYFVCLEGALKLKEISYIQAEGFAGGELKHGTIALIEEGTPVIALATQRTVNGSIRGNVSETEARGAHPCVISLAPLGEQGDAIVMPPVHEYLTPLVSVVPMQLLAYYEALHRGCDVDKPRNLAKSVTVE